jgi:hypothetical protein
MFRKDNLKLGVAIGFIAPVIAILAYYFVVYYPINATFAEFLNSLKANKNALTGISSACLLANAVVFTLYINNLRDKTAKGIFLSTLIYGIAVLVVKVMN